MNHLKTKIQSLALASMMALSVITPKAEAKAVSDQKFGKGISLAAADSSFTMKFTTRIQNRMDTDFKDNEEGEWSNKAYLRRARLKFGGFAFDPTLVYKMEFDVVNGEVLDAVVKWNFVENFHLWFGQTKLAGNRERVISSQKLQFVDRSLLNKRYNIDRDKGIQLRHSITIGDILIREVVSASMGEGKNVKDASIGNNYTGRLEILPFGQFTGKGDYFSSDLKREKSPKLSLGATYDFNHNAVRSGGQLGDFMEENRDLKTIFADMMFKFRGISVMAEYADKRTATSDPMSTIKQDDGSFKDKSFYTGTGLNVQAGYLFHSNWEIAARYTQINPEVKTQNNDHKQYTLGISKYIVGHSLKVQTDYSLLEEEGLPDAYQNRFQVELSF